MQFHKRELAKREFSDVKGLYEIGRVSKEVVISFANQFSETKTAVCFDIRPADYPIGVVKDHRWLSSSAVAIFIEKEHNSDIERAMAAHA